MFEFFKGMIEKVGVKLVSDFTEKLIDFIKGIKENSEKSNNDGGNNFIKIGSSGYRAQIGSSGYRAQIEISGDNSVSFACGYKSMIKGKKELGFHLQNTEKTMKERGFRHLQNLHK